MNLRPARQRQIAVRMRDLLRLGRDILISAFVVAILLAAVWLPFQVLGYQMLDGRVETDGIATRYAGSHSVACSYWHVTGYETFLRVYHANEPRDDYACPRLRKRGDEPFVLLFDE
jgi:hypothetical protein